MPRTLMFMLLSAAVIDVAAHAATAPRAPQSLPMRKSVELPTSRRVFPGSGPGAAAANSYCLMCHSYGMVANQPALSAAAWRVEVDKMRHAFKAPIPAAEVPVIAQYIARLKGAR
jgi:cytochrome c5